MKLTRKFYQNEDVVAVARSLLAKTLVVKSAEGVSAARITETEAYSGADDLACHAFRHGLTPRTSVIFGEAGYSYVYLCYGIHHLFNVVTNIKGRADAVLIRAVEPTEGLDLMENRRGITASSIALSAGPGKLTKALGIGSEHYGVDLTKEVIWIEENGSGPDPDEIEVDTRIGVESAGKDALRPWRFFLKNNKWISKGLVNKSLLPGNPMTPTSR